MKSALVCGSTSVRPSVWVKNIGADFHRAVVATAPGEKLLIGRLSVRNWTRRTISSVIFVQKITSVLRKSNKKIHVGFWCNECTPSVWVNKSDILLGVGGVAQL